MGEVGSYKVFENEKIIIWELILEPSEQTACHTHQHDYIFMFLKVLIGMKIFCFLSLQIQEMLLRLSAKRANLFQVITRDYK